MPYKNRKSPRAKASQKKSNQKYYLKNKTSHRKHVKQTKTNIKSFLKQYKEKHGCMDCKAKGSFYQWPYYVLDFDHREGEVKKYSLSSIHKKTNWSNTLIEIRKCDVVCSNCHRIRTHNRGQYSRKKTIES